MVIQRCSRTALLVVAGMLVAVLVGCGATTKPPVKAPDVSSIREYVAIPGGGTLGPATASLTQADGTTWAFNRPAAGQLTLVYFGYTSCPDVCPTTLADLARALSQLPDEVTAKVWVQFVSTDPDRDTPSQITSWLGRFDSRFHGGFAPIDQVIAAAQTYGIGIDAPTPNPAGGYQVTHGAQLLVLDPTGAAVGYFRELAGATSYQTGLPILVDAYT